MGGWKFVRILNMKEGVPIEVINPQPTVRKNAETAPDWEYREQAQYLYDRAVLFRERLIDPIARIDRAILPDPVVSFDDLRNKRTLAAYTLIRNPQGMNHEITFNTEHYQDAEGKKIWKFGEWALNETLLHEQIHLWQQTVGSDSVKLGKVYHNKEFVDKCENLGLHPMPGKGCHVAVADGVFAQLMGELGIERPEMPPTEEMRIDWFKFLEDWLGKEAKGRSTLKLWCCPGCGLKVRMGVQSDPMLRHHVCENAENPMVFLIPGDVYKAMKK